MIILGALSFCGPCAYSLLPSFDPYCADRGLTLDDARSPICPSLGSLPSPYLKPSSA